MLKDFKAAAVLAFILLAFQLGGYFYNNKDHYKLQDPDCYMRLVRVQEFEKTHDWHNSVIYRSNAPYGEELHWTRPFDLLLLAGAKILQPFLGFKKALLIFGIIISPLLQFASALALIWAVSVFFKDIQEKLRLAILFLLQPGSYIPFLAGRPDHHGLLLLFFIIEIGFFLRLLYKPSEKNAWILGALLAFSMWLSIESLTVVFLFFAALGVIWISDKEKSLSSITVTAMSLFLFSTVFLIIERPISLLTFPEYDRISIVHVLLFALSAFLFLSLTNLERRKLLPKYFPSRTALLLLGGGLILGMMGHAFPKFFQGPYAQVDPHAVEVWLRGVKEVRPLFKLGHEPFHRVVIWLGPLFVCLPFLIYKLLKTRRSSKEWPMWIFSSVGIAIFASLSFYQIRWVYYASVLLLLPFTYVLNLTIQKLKYLKKPWFALARACTIIIFTCGFLTLGILMMLSKKAEPKKPTASSIEMCQYLKENFTETQRVATFIDMAAEILYLTPHEVIGSPYHRNGQGIIFINDLMTAPDDQTALKLLRQRNISLILINTASSYFNLYQKGDTFCRRLVEGKLPLWLKKIDTPENLSSNFHLFKVL